MIEITLSTSINHVEFVISAKHRGFAHVLAFLGINPTDVKYLHIRAVREGVDDEANPWGIKGAPARDEANLDLEFPDRLRIDADGPGDWG